MRSSKPSLQMRALAQQRDNGSVLWYGGSSLVHIATVHHLLAAATTSMRNAPPTEKINQWRISSYGTIARQLVVTGSVQNYETRLFKLGAHRNITFLNSTRKPWRVFGSESLPCCNQRLGFPLCACQELSAPLSNNIKASFQVCYAIACTPPSSSVCASKVSAMRCAENVLTITFL